MSREWKSGDVQVVLSMHPSRVKGFSSWLHRLCADDSLGDSIAKQIDEQGHGARLVVIDPEDREQVSTLMDTYDLRGAIEGILCRRADDRAWERITDAMQAALRSLVEPPKPEEPTGIGAVVEYDGSVWISLGHHRWLELPDDRLIEPRRFHWADFPSGVRNLSDGWTPDAAGGAS